MSTATTIPVKYNIADATIEEMGRQYLSLVVTDVTDQAQVKAVHDARMIVRKARVGVEKKRTELKADALAYGRRVDAEAKRLKALIEPIESHLLAEENKVKEAEEARRRELEERQRAVTQKRVDDLQAVGVVMPWDDVQALSDSDFAALLAESGAAFKARKAEEERLAKERAEQEERNRIEAARLAEEQAKLAAEREAREAAQRRLEQQRHELELERQRIEAEKQARLAEIEAAKEAERREAEAAERARTETEERLKREEAERKEREAAEKAEADRIAALRPDREKIEAFAASLLAVERPALSRKAAAKRASAEIGEIVTRAAGEIRDVAANL